MVERGLYYATTDFAQMIKNNGGTWNDTKHRPIVCLIKSKEHGELYWAIPMGKLNHRDDAGQKRLDFYLNLPEIFVPVTITSGGLPPNPFSLSAMPYPSQINT